MATSTPSAEVPDIRPITNHGERTRALALADFISIGRAILGVFEFATLKNTPCALRHELCPGLPTAKQRRSSNCAGYKRMQQD